VPEKERREDEQRHDHEAPPLVQRRPREPEKHGERRREGKRPDEYVEAERQSLEQRVTEDPEPIADARSASPTLLLRLIRAAFNHENR
jgi:hypothetical protein